MLRPLHPTLKYCRLRQYFRGERGRCGMHSLCARPAKSTPRRLAKLFDGKNVAETGDLEDFLDRRAGPGNLHRLRRHLLLRRQQHAEPGGRDVVHVGQVEDQFFDSVRDYGRLQFGSGERVNTADGGEGELGTFEVFLDFHGDILFFVCG